MGPPPLPAHLAFTRFHLLPGIGAAFASACTPPLIAISNAAHTHSYVNSVGKTFPSNFQTKMTFNREDTMTTLPPQPFDENNIKYFCCFKKLHIRTAARIVAIALICGIIVNLLYSFGRTSTVIIYSWILAAFAVGVYGSLCYSVFKEKRIFTMPFLVFQATFILLFSVIFLIFMVCAMFSANSIRVIAADFAGISEVNKTVHDVQKYNEDVRGFVVLAMMLSVVFICLQCWFFEIIYRFYQYLEDRESSFAFNLEPEFTVA